MEKPIIHCVGNAHLDPVWLWRFQEGFAEIKATFRSALDRIRDYGDFIFTSACASYYQWIEENCPPMFEEIKNAVKAGKWAIVGGMWLQPDCNMPSAESFARHFLYSQRYFEEKFGVRVRTGYNVDSFGHTATLPKLLNEAGIENYVYMRPYHGGEKDYGFPSHTFRWKCGDNEVTAFRIRVPYNVDCQNPETLTEYEQYAVSMGEPLMLFYGVGNHGGGPTIRQVEGILSHQATSGRSSDFSHPDRFFQQIRETIHDKIPVYEGELQNHASGCYSANSRIKQYNRISENRLGEAERMEVLAAWTMGTDMNPAKNAEAWKNVLFNQFHDILCGCSIKEAYDDAYAFSGAAIAHGLKLTNEAAQCISWNIDTKRNIEALSKDRDWIVWDHEEAGMPVVVFNPLSHAVTVPVTLHRNACTAVTDAAGAYLPFQTVRAEYTNCDYDSTGIRFLANVPAYGWATFWSFNTEKNKMLPESSILTVSQTMLRNDKVTVVFDETTGNISSIITSDGIARTGAHGCHAYVLDDTQNDTWAHNQFVFDAIIGEFSQPEFAVIENGACEVSLMVKQHYQNSTLEQIYTLYPGDARIHTRVRLILNEIGVMIKLAFDSGIKDARFVREAPGGIIACETNAREEPMLRFMLAEKDGSGLAVINDCKYSASMKDGVLALIAARSCYYADHYAKRDNRMVPQDIGEQEFSYVIMPYDGNLSNIFAAAEECNCAFPVIPETYHKGTLPQCYTGCSIDNTNVSVTCVKPAEDGNGIIVRVSETSGTAQSCSITFGDMTWTAELTPFAIHTYRIANGHAVLCDFTETAR